MISHHAALIYTMVLSAASDNDVSQIVLESIRDTMSGLPIFEDFERGNERSPARRWTS